MSTAPAELCVICTRQLWEDEIEPARRPACRLCEKRGTAIIRDLPRLYRELGGRLQRGQNGNGGGRVTGSKHAPLPCNDDALTLRGPGPGGIAYGAVFWEQAIREELGYPAAPFRGDYQQTIDGSAHWLATSAPWIYGTFLAVDEMHSDFRRLHTQATALIEGSTRGRTLTLACPCGAVLKGVTLQTDGRRCTSCGTQYGWTDLCQLRPVNGERAAA